MVLFGAPNVKGVYHLQKFLVKKKGFVKLSRWKGMEFRRGGTFEDDEKIEVILSPTFGGKSPCRIRDRTIKCVWYNQKK